VNEVAIHQFFALPYDRWEGYAVERTEILEFIRDRAISNVIFLTTDLHANLVQRVKLGEEPVAWEFVAGPIATDPLAEEIRSVSNRAPAVFHLLLDFTGVECRNTKSLGYGLIEVDDEQVTISLKDAEGNIIRSERNTSQICTKTLFLPWKDKPPSQ
jgi:phosphodiesterase/alkaline phosphatase D-like protein